MSSVVAFTFGSFGDIATIIQLASALRTTLNAASSASEEIAAIVADITSFTDVLGMVEVNLAKLEASRDPNAETARAAIRRSLDICGRLLQRMTALIAKHRQRFERRYGRRRWKRYWAACTWYLIGGKTVADSLRRQLFDQGQFIQHVLLQLINGSVTTIMDILVHGSPNALNEARSTAESPCNRVKTGGIPFQFFDYGGNGVMPLLNIPWPRWIELCKQFQFFRNTYHELKENKLHNQTLYSSNGRKAWFQVYIYPDQTGTSHPSVLVSPVFHVHGKSNTLRRPAAGSSKSADATSTPSVRFLAFTSKYDVIFDEARVSLTLTKLIEYGDKWLDAASKQIRNNNQIRALDGENGRKLRLTISRVVDGDYRCNLATVSASHVVAIGTEYYGF